MRTQNTTTGAENTTAAQKEKAALAILKPIFSKVGWSPIIGCDLCMTSLRTSKSYVTLFRWSEEFAKETPDLKRSEYKNENGEFDREAWRKDCAARNDAMQKWFTGKLTAIQDELKAACAKNRWRFRTAGTQIRIDL
jgi:hypothetical protein